MEILYIANIRLPTEKAHGIQIMKMCEAFSDLGHDVTLVIPSRLNRIKNDPFKYFGVKKNFKIKKLPTIDLVKFGKIGFLIQTISFSKFALLHSLLNKPDVIYSRDEIPVFFLSLFKNNIYWESHTNTYNFFVKKFIKKIRGVITITDNLKDFYIKKGVANSKILVAHDAVDIEEFSVSMSKMECRDKLNLPKDKKIVIYTGHLYSWKGVDVLVKSTEFLDDSVMVVFVGGTDKRIKEFKYENTSKNILILGRKLHKEIPYYLKSADVLALPNTAKEDISKLYTSPMKLFEYMASGVPIVASDLPSIREILSEEISTLVEADNPKAFADGIKNALKKDGKKALNDVRMYTWRNRAVSVLKFIT